MTATLRPAALLKGQLVAPQVRIEDAVLRLVRRTDGRNNWTVGSAQTDGAELEPFRGTHSFQVDDGRLEFIDAQRALHFRGRFRHQSDARAPLALEDVAALDGFRVLVRARGEPLNGPQIGDPYLSAPS